MSFRWRFAFHHWFRIFSDISYLSIWLWLWLLVWLKFGISVLLMFAILKKIKWIQSQNYSMNEIKSYFIVSKNNFNAKSNASFAAIFSEYQIPWKLWVTRCYSWNIIPFFYRICIPNANIQRLSIHFQKIAEIRKNLK